MRGVSRGSSASARGRSSVREGSALRVAPLALRVGGLALLSAGVVALAGAQAFWVCVPTSLIACAWASDRRAAAVSLVTVVGAAGAAAFGLAHRGSTPAPLVAVLVPAASAAVVVIVRERLERERDVMRDFALRDPLT